MTHHASTRCAKELVGKGDAGFFPATGVAPQVAIVDAVDFATLFAVAAHFGVLGTVATLGGRGRRRSQSLPRAAVNGREGRRDGRNAGRETQPTPVIHQRHAVVHFLNNLVSQAFILFTL